MTKILIFVFILLASVSCNRDVRPAGILSPEQMEPVLWEQMKADAFTKEFIVKDTTKDPVRENLILQDKIFRKYKTDRKTFYLSYRYYLEHEDQMKVLLDSMLVKEGRLKERDRKKKIFNIRRNGQNL